MKSDSTEPLWNVLYVSSASYVLQQDDFDRLLADARRWNSDIGVTGMLLHCGGNFMQLLEGPRQAVLTTFSRVLASRQHSGVLELLNGPAAFRIFGDWAMADARMNPQQFEEMLRSARSGQVQLQLLRDFWDGNR